ncbi:MAG TPA: HlyD family efflux transporter periplasmic adaptor subunit [Acidimicrobiales bacterium]|nr:HlyD family efflux transporter periplasmic adaptor subunit [Acidimicrobiales bacterium]
MAGLLIFGISTLAWATISTLSTSISAIGYVVPALGWSGVQAPTSGTVTAVKVTTNAVVSSGGVVAVISDPATDREVAVHADSAGVVAELSATVGQYVQAGNQLAIISPDVGPLVVQAFFPVGVAREIAPGATADISVSSAPSAAFGYLSGRVRSVAALPATMERLDAVLLNPALAEQVTAHGPVVEVLVQLETASTVSGYAWTLAHGPEYPAVESGEPASVSIVVGHEHPIEDVF